jgi:hypothetical protein
MLTIMEFDCHCQLIKIYQPNLYIYIGLAYRLTSILFNITDGLNTFFPSIQRINVGYLCNLHVRIYIVFDNFSLSFSFYIIKSISTPY